MYLCREPINYFQYYFIPSMNRKLEVLRIYYLCLIMPWYMPIPKKDRKNLLNNGKIEESLKAFANTNYKHLNIKSRVLSLDKIESFSSVGRHHFSY